MHAHAFRRLILRLAGAAPLVFSPISMFAQQSSAAQSPDPAPAQPARQIPPPPAGRISRPPIRYVLPRRSYLCTDDVRITVLVETKAIRLTLADHIYNLKQVEPSGTSSETSTDTNPVTKYSDGSVVWTTNGKVSSLKDISDREQPKTLAKACHLQSSFPPISSAPPPSN
jgi:membrane-bound inhibitor of C-type lysozyme